MVVWFIEAFRTLITGTVLSMENLKLLPSSGFSERPSVTLRTVIKIILLHSLQILELEGKGIEGSPTATS